MTIVCQHCPAVVPPWVQHRVAGDVPTPRYFHSCAVHNGSMYVFGGYNGTDRLCDFFEHNFETGTWTELVSPNKRKQIRRRVYLDETTGESKKKRDEIDGVDM